MNKWTRVTGVIIEEGSVLLFRRVKKGNEYYTFPGGAVEEGESIEEALVREIEEEVCLTVESFRPLGVIENIPITSEFLSRTGTMDNVMFLVECWSGAPELGGPEKERHCEDNQYHIEWISLEELKKMDNVYPVGMKDKVLEEVQSA